MVLCCPPDSQNGARQGLRRQLTDGFPPIALQQGRRRRQKPERIRHTEWLVEAVTRTFDDIGRGVALPEEDMPERQRVRARQEPRSVEFAPEFHVGK
jgi:hypothetical protein